MGVFLYTEAEMIDPETESHYSFISSFKDYTTPHTHEFFEFFIITDGKVVHNVNSTSQVLQDGSLVFMRPDDIHSYEKYRDFDCKFINIAFSQKAFLALFNYLGNDFPWDPFLKPSAPPCIILPKVEKWLLKQKLDGLNLLPLSQKHVIKTEFRALLVDIFARCFIIEYGKSARCNPLWLQELCDLMAKKENFTMGLEAMKTLSGKSHEHLCRLFKRYFGSTPTEYINNLRLNYAANMLVNSDMDILSISLDSGFENLSHFYHIFKKQFGTSPSDFRKINQKVIIDSIYTADHFA